MPNAKILSEKQAIVAELTEKLQNAAAGVIVDYKGITVAEDTELRAKMREAGVDYFVMKNTLSRFAVKNAGLDELCDVLKGTTSIALCQGDPVAAAKVVSEFSKKLAAQEKFTVKAGFVDGKVIDAAGVKALADLPSKEVLVATVLGTTGSPYRTRSRPGHCAGRQHLWPGSRCAGHRRSKGLTPLHENIIIFTLLLEVHYYG